MPEAVSDRGQGYAGPAWFQSDHPGKRLGQAKWHAFIYGFAYEPGLMSHLPKTAVTQWA